MGVLSSKAPTILSANTSEQNQTQPGSVVVALYRHSESQTELAMAVVERLFPRVSRRHCCEDSAADVDSLSNVTMKICRFSSDAGGIPELASRTRSSQLTLAAALGSPPSQARRLGL